MYRNQFPALRVMSLDGARELLEQRRERKVERCAEKHGHVGSPISEVSGLRFIMSYFSTKSPRGIDIVRIKCLLLGCSKWRALGPEKNDLEIHPSPHFLYLFYASNLYSFVAKLGTEIILKILLQTGLYKMSYYTNKTILYFAVHATFFYI